MSLITYKKKRNFTKTSEPEGGKGKKGAHIFVVQRHHASRIHYDFRLEVAGVLKSWAVPKGPSRNPGDKRLAMHVEDHPLEYRNFEGIIPKGNYGGGTGMLWGEGVYWARGAKDKDRRENEEILESEYEKGRMSFVLDGKKLKGEYALVRLH